MSISVTIKLAEIQKCPHCGKEIGFVRCKDNDHGILSGGAKWRKLLKDIKYYTDEWYGKDMVLNEEQKKTILNFLQKESRADLAEFQIMLQCSKEDRAAVKTDIVISADW